MPDCVFCDIVDGRAPAKLVDTTADSIAIRPRHPVTDNHVLVIPRTHVQDAADNPQVTAATMRDAAALAPCLAGDFNLITSAGTAATQTVFHLHIHVVPRRDGDGLTLPWTGQVKA